MSRSKYVAADLCNRFANGERSRLYFILFIFFFLDLHEQRLKKLRELLKVLAQDDWMYPSADKLIGLK